MKELKGTKVYIVNEESTWDDEPVSWDEPKIFANLEDAFAAFNKAVREADNDWCEQFDITKEDMLDYDDTDEFLDEDIVRNISYHEKMAIYDSYQAGFANSFSISITLKEVTIQ